MKVLCHIAATALLVAASAFACADPADFKAHVLDPPPPAANAPFPTYPIGGSPFTVTFTACQTGELPGGNTADGCFSGVNRSGYDWLGLEFAFDNTPALGSQPADCSPAPNSNVYSRTNCMLDPTAGPTGTYFLDFAGGVIQNGEFFFVTETGVDPSLFPPGTATITNAPTVTPEPSSLLLLLTGVPGAGVLARRVVRRSRSQEGQR